MKFKREHFSNLEFRVSGWQDVPRAAADYANAVLEAHLATLPVVYCKHGDRFHLNTTFMKVVDTKEEATHEALLWDVKPIEKKECEHVFPDFSITSNDACEYISVSGRCKHCGVKLKATWSPA